MASDIKVSSLTVAIGVGQLAITIESQSPAGMSCLAYMQPASFELWEATTNNRSGAAKVADSSNKLFIRDVVGTRYYWARAVDPAGNLGEFFPVSATGGVAATTKTADPGPNSVGPDELKNNAVQTQHLTNLLVTAAKIANLAVTNAKIASLSADKITAGIISATIQILGPTITGGLIQTAASGARVWMGTPNGIYVTNSLGGTIGSLTAGTFGYVLNINADQRAAQIRGDIASTGADAAAVEIKNSANGLALTAQATASGVAAHGFRAIGSGNTSNRGMGLVGVSASSGGHAFLAERGGYAPFTGVHEAFILKAAELLIGDIVCDVKVVSRNGVDDTITEVERSSFVKDKRAVGIVSTRGEFLPGSIMPALPDRQSQQDTSFIRDYLAAKYDRLAINSVGEGQLNVCGLGGDIEAGDLICSSSMPGKGQRQNLIDGSADDLVRNYTVARARESMRFDYPEQRQRLACIYLCG